MRVNNLSKVALGSAAAGIEPAISSRKSNALTTTSPSHQLNTRESTRYPHDADVMKLLTTRSTGRRHDDVC